MGLSLSSFLVHQVRTRELLFPELRSLLVLIGNRSTRVETEQINHLDHWSDAQANFARGAIDA